MEPEYSIPDPEQIPEQGGVEGKEPQGMMGKLSRIGTHLAIVAGILTALSTLGGLTWNLIESANATREKRFAVRVAQLTSFADFGDILKHYREIGNMSNRVTRTFQGRTWNCDSLLHVYGSGAGIYYSDEMKEYAHVREFYEDLGLLIRYQAIDFELVYQSIIFPDDFVAATKPLTDCIGANWFARGKGIAGFSSNMLLLQKNYNRVRKGEKPIWDYFH